MLSKQEQEEFLKKEEKCGNSSIDNDEVIIEYVGDKVAIAKKGMNYVIERLQQCVVISYVITKDDNKRTQK